MKEDRFLTVILVVIGLLVVVSLGVYFLKEDTATYQSDDTPEGIIHNYIFALEKGDYERAYGYLADKKNKPDYDEFRQDLFIDRRGRRGLQIGEVNISEDTASVEITITESNRGPFFDQYSYSESALLIKQDGEWKVFQMPYSYWSWNWYQDEN